MITEQLHELAAVLAAGTGLGCAVMTAAVRAGGIQLVLLPPELDLTATACGLAVSGARVRLQVVGAGQETGQIAALVDALPSVVSAVPPPWTADTAQPGAAEDGTPMYTIDLEAGA